MSTSPERYVLASDYDELAELFASAREIGKHQAAIIMLMATHLAASLDELRGPENEDLRSAIREILLSAPTPVEHMQPANQYKEPT